jgi:hypothetical protein
MLREEQSQERLSQALFKGLKRYADMVKEGL